MEDDNTRLYDAVEGTKKIEGCDHTWYDTFFVKRM